MSDKLKKRIKILIVWQCALVVVAAFGACALGVTTFGAASLYWSVPLFVSVAGWVVAMLCEEYWL